ncbi:hypothetical protein JY504_09465 [Corynebacterium amycolatum]|uniref:hypothetical protein n=1 Tax=Corynebacterium amycolatum TaxID=43765 RepID=UPI00211AA3B7|nr:hypothetical protein [Corynebacterium amycolatum]MCQ9126226.1 hypothetical protein [Corynebacterium amycolatum]MCQ9127379.1 hypothetical protein [Corynebacterium amycolatum]MCQ9142100.1 hypothetical protein [Corynebacterium amycolatum]MCQ9170236.1 hypothetical protein [Corynebacterium amycolatum]MCQ9175354.1 hypothetical protein [Corynebacterium amycolatum]
MSEEKLTVAELLARRQKEGAPSEPPRRRRRRSLEEGGVSVQELTGSIPRVKAGEPRRGAHALSNADDGQTTTSDLLADEAATNGTEEARASEPEAEAPEHSEAVAESVIVAEEADSSEHEVQAEVEAEAAAPVAPATPQQEQAAPSMPTTQPAAPAVPLAIPMEPRPVMVNSERSEITYTFTELRDMADESQQIGEPGPVARAVLTGSNAYDDRPTASIPVVQDSVDEEAAASAESDDVDGEQLAESETTEAPEEKTRVLPQVEEADAVGETEAAQETDTFEATDADADTGAASEAAAAAAVAPEVAQPEDVGAKTTPTQVAADEKQSEPQDVVKREKPKSSKGKVAARDGYAEDNSLSVPLLLVQVFVGLIAGALVFLGFTMAWSSLPKIVVVIMALVVAGSFAGMANYLRREKDKLTPILAGLVGLALTFGPWILFQL